MSTYSTVQQTDYVPQLNLSSSSNNTYLDCGMPIKLTGLILYFTSDVTGFPEMTIYRRPKGGSTSSGAVALGDIRFTSDTPLPQAGDTVHFDFNNIDETGTVGNRGDRFVLQMTAAGGGNCIVGFKAYPFENTRSVQVYGEVPRGKSSPAGRVVDGAKFVEAS